MPAVDWSKVLPVLISVGVILLVAALRQYSRTFASIAAVMPVTIPLTLAIIYFGTPDKEREAVMTPFAYSVAVNLIPTVVFAFVAWRMFASGYGLWTTLIVSYLIWAISLAVMFALRAWFKF